jgi:hypothetical protein
MKVLIIALPRTGSTSLMKQFVQTNKLRPIFEPFGVTNSNKPNLNYDTLNNIVVKTMIFDVDNDETDSILFYTEFSKKFDKVILLSRRSLKECAESLAYMEKHINNGYILDKQYVWDSTGLDVNGRYIFLQKQNSDLEKLSDVLNIPIIYYEDIFDTNSTERYRKNIKINKSKLI